MNGPNSGQSRRAWEKMLKKVKNSFFSQIVERKNVDSSVKPRAADVRYLGN